MVRRACAAARGSVKLAHANMYVLKPGRRDGCLQGAQLPKDGAARMRNRRPCPVESSHPPRRRAARLGWREAAATLLSGQLVGNGMRRVIDLECVLPPDENGVVRQFFGAAGHRIGEGDPELLPPLEGYGFANYRNIFTRREGGARQPEAAKPAGK